MDKHEQEEREAMAELEGHAEVKGAWLAEKLKDNSEVEGAWLSDVHAGGADVYVLYGRRRLPMGFLDLVSEHGDLRIEGTDGTNVELVIQI